MHNLFRRFTLKKKTIFLQKKLRIMSEINKEKHNEL